MVRDALASHDIVGAANGSLADRELELHVKQFWNLVEQFGSSPSIMEL